MHPPLRPRRAHRGRARAPARRAARRGGRLSPRPARALVIGASGFLGSRLLANAPRDIDTTGTGWDHPVRPGPWREALLDVTSPSAVRAMIERERPGLVFYVAYDKAQRDVTVDGARAAAAAAAARGARFVLISTDLVFDGNAGNYSEAVPAMPIMPYGQLKLEAETAARDASNAAVILRLSLLWGESGITLRPAYECDTLMGKQPIDAYTDEWRSPLYVDDAARAAWELGVSDTEGIYHLGGPERLSRFELARRLCTIYGFDRALVREARRPEDRPRDTSLDSSRLLGLLDWTPRTVVPEPAVALSA